MAYIFKHESYDGLNVPYPFLTIYHLIYNYITCTYFIIIGFSISSGFSQCSKSTPNGTTGASLRSFCFLPLRGPSGGSGHFCPPSFDLDGSVFASDLEIKTHTMFQWMFLNKIKTALDSQKEFYQCRVYY